MHPEELYIQRDEINEKIQAFLLNEVNVYLEYRNTYGVSNFKAIYNKVGKNIYTNPVLIKELNIIYDLHVQAHKAKLKASKNKPTPTKDKVFQLLDFDKTLTIKQVCATLNLNYSRVYPYFKKHERIRIYKKSRVAENPLPEGFVKTTGTKSYEYLNSILNNR